MITLDRLINVLGGYGARWLTGVADRQTELRSVVLPEVVDGRTVAGDVLLAVGAASLDEALHWAQSARAAVVLTRGAVSDPALDTGGVAVVVVDSAMPWSDFAAIVYGLVMEGRETESGRGPTDLFALADSLADAVGCAVVIEDRALRCWRSPENSGTQIRRALRPSSLAKPRRSCGPFSTRTASSRTSRNPTTRCSYRRILVSA